MGREFGSSVVSVEVISVRAKRVSSVMFVSNRDFRYVRMYIYIYICGRTSSYVHMLNSSLLGNKKLHSPVVHNVEGVKFRPVTT